MKINVFCDSLIYLDMQQSTSVLEQFINSVSEGIKLNFLQLNRFQTKPQNNNITYDDDNKTNAENKNKTK